MLVNTCRCGRNKRRPPQDLAALSSALEEQIAAARAAGVEVSAIDVDVMGRLREVTQAEVRRRAFFVCFLDAYGHVTSYRLHAAWHKNWPGKFELDGFLRAC